MSKPLLEKDADEVCEHYGIGSAGWVCEMIADFYVPNIQIDRRELTMDVNHYFQSFGGLRRLPCTVTTANFSDRAPVRANDPKQLQTVWTVARRLYWSVYDVAPWFWQQQFSDRTLLATGLVRAIAWVVIQVPQPSRSSQRLNQWLKLQTVGNAQ